MFEPGGKMLMRMDERVVSIRYAFLQLFEFQTNAVPCFHLPSSRFRCGVLGPESLQPTATELAAATSSPTGFSVTGRRAMLTLRHRLNMLMCFQVPHVRRGGSASGGVLVRGRVGVRNHLPAVQPAIQDWVRGQWTCAATAAQTGLLR